MNSHSTTQLPQRPTFADIQQYVAAMEKERGFDKDTDTVRAALQLTEEVGELCKAIRKKEKMSVAQDSTVSEVSDELADVLIFIVAIANRYSIDLESAFRSKEEKNKRRTWV